MANPKVGATSAVPLHISIAAASDLAVSGDLTVADDATITGDLTVTTLTAGRVPFASTAGLLVDDGDLTFATATLTATNLVVTTALTQGASGSIAAGSSGLSTTGDVSAAGGFRQSIGPWAAEIAASQTDTRGGFGDASPASGSWVAPRAGSVTALSVQLSGAITGATNISVVFGVYKNGTKLHAAYDLTFTRDGAQTALYVVVAKDTHAFVAGDVLDVRYTSGLTTNFETFWASIEIEC